jgi:hypothetical protein
METNNCICKTKKSISNSRLLPASHKACTFSVTVISYAPAWRKSAYRNGSLETSLSVETVVRSRNCTFCPSNLNVSCTNECKVTRFQAYAPMVVKFPPFWDITQRRVVILYACFGTTYRSQPECYRLSSWISVPFKTELIGCPETSVHNYHSTLRNITEEHRYNNKLFIKRHHIWCDSWLCQRRVKSGQRSWRRCPWGGSSAAQCYTVYSRKQTSRYIGHGQHTSLTPQFAVWPSAGFLKPLTVSRPHSESPAQRDDPAVR